MSTASSPLLEVAGVAHAYHGRSALHEVSFELDRGETLALYGPNGSGKSTLLKIIGGLIEPSMGGSMRLAGVDLQSYDRRARARSIAYVGAELNSEFPLKVEQAVLLGRLPHRTGYSFGIPSRPVDREQVERALMLCQCQPLRERLIDSLSSGERQRVALARAIAQQPKVLLLDESLGRMDLQHQWAMIHVLRRLASEEGLAIVIVTHDPNLWSDWADRALLLQAGRRLGWGRVESVITSENMVRLFPGAPLRVVASPTHGRPKVIVDLYSET